MNIQRQGEIARLLDIAEARHNGPHDNFSADLAGKAHKLSRAQAEAEDGAKGTHSRLSKILGDDTPSADELTEYINELAKAALNLKR